MMNSPSRKRTISEANNNSMFHQVSYDDRMIDENQQSSVQGGLRRRRIGGSDNNIDEGGALLSNNGTNNSNDNGIVQESFVQQSPSVPTLPSSQQHQSVVPLSMQLMRPFWQISCCPDCRVRPSFSNSGSSSFNEDFFAGNNTGNNNGHLAASRNVSMEAMNGAAEEAAGGRSQEGNAPSNGAMASFKRAANSVAAASNDSSYTNHSPISSVASFGSCPAAAAMIPSTPSRSLSSTNQVSIEQLLHEYTTACSIYGCSNRMNPGVLTTFRFSLPTLRVSGSFFDADMLALTEVLLKHCNGALSYIKRLDFTIAGKEGKDRGYGGFGGGGGGSGKKGIRSHGAYALSKVLSQSRYIEEVYLSGNRIGPYGSSAIFTAAAQNAKEGGGNLRTLLLRGCRIGERGALLFAEEICSVVPEKNGGLKEVDLSANRIGFRGCFAIEEALKGRMENERCEDGGLPVQIDLEGNMVFQEVMNCVTHGLGILLGTLGTYLLNNQISGCPSHYTLSCAIYSASVIVLYTSSTLYHSFFALKKTKFIFQVFDKCAIYILIAGSYTPFLMIALHHEPLWSLHLLLFIWACAISGILVEALAMQWEHKKKFSLAMYLGMGWSCMTCMPDLVEVLPMSALVLVVAGGVSYTGGVPFFVRNNNLDHSIWHLFVLAGSIFHWLAVYWYVAIP